MTKKAQKTKESKKPKVLMALSGGIDSAISAHLLLKQGFEVEAAFMKNWSSTNGLKYQECPWLEDRREALRVAAFFGIPFHTLDFEEQYAKRVMDYFFKEYKAGRTPNPDVMCNKEIKFKLLYDFAMKNGFDYMATGHYAQVKNGKLYRSLDENKDQTYFIYNLNPEQLEHVMFPVGHLQKPKVRALARKLKLPNAERNESMGLCFVGKIRLKDFLEQKLKRKPGKILDQEGKVIGEHEGLHYYTIGQRQGIKIGAGGPFYVTKKDISNNTLHVTSNPEDKNLYIKEIWLSSIHFVSEIKKFPSILTGRFRHQGDLVKLKLEKDKTGSFKVTFNKPQKAIASGQSLVLYSGTQCIGGGVIQ